MRRKGFAGLLCIAASALSSGCGDGEDVAVTGGAEATSTAAGPRSTNFTASGPITATSGQVISGLRISNPNGDCVSIPVGATGVVVRDSEIGPCGRRGIFVAGADALIEYVSVRNANQGLLAERTGGTVTRLSKFDAIAKNAIAYAYMTSGTMDGNVVTGDGYSGDVINFFESSNVRLTNNDINVGIIDCSTCAAFTMGDTTSRKPGSNMYASGNIIRQRGNGVAAGVFGSEGNAVMERNCFSAGIQAYNYAGIFVGVTVRDNVINLAASYVPDPASIQGWNSNINSSDCSLLKK